MFIDKYGNEFKTEKEVKDFAIQSLYEDDWAFVDTLEHFVGCAELLDWITENPTVFEKFKKDYEQVIKIVEKDYAEIYLDNCNKIEN
jgi:hypothetical protein